MKKRMFPITVLAGLLVLASCKKNNTDTPAPEKPKDVYVAGAEANANFTDGQATYWKNGTKVNLPTTAGSFSEAHSIFVTDDAVYVAGRDVAEGVVYWKNGTKVKLAGLPEGRNASGIVVKGNDVYVSGIIREGGLVNVACYWKNGVKYILGNATHPSEAGAIAVSGNDVYVTGNEYGTGGFGGYWKNGVPVNLSTGHYRANIISIFISGNDVYLCGYIIENNIYKAAYWKNNTLVLLHDQNSNPIFYSYANSIYVKDDIVYAAGNEENLITGESAATYWVNGVKKYLPAPPNFQGEGKSIFISGKDIYIAGYSYDQKAILWKNEVWTVLEQSSGRYATCVFVK
jgi:hypothetical protein